MTGRPEFIFVLILIKLCASNSSRLDCETFLCGEHSGRRSFSVPALHLWEGSWEVKSSFLTVP